LKQPGWIATQQGSLAAQRRIQYPPISAVLRYDHRMTDQAAAPRCALYARTSRADPAGALQFRAMRKFTHGRGWRVYGEFVDARYPGAMDQQPALDELMHEASKHQFDCIVVTKLDRFAFSYTGLVGRLQRLADLGVRFISVLQSVDTGEFVATADGSLVRTGDVLLSVARACSGFDSLREFEQPDRTPCRSRTGTSGEKRARRLKASAPGCSGE
jgi:hypothetical protein